MKTLVENAQNIAPTISPQPWKWSQWNDTTWTDDNNSVVIFNTLTRSAVLMTKQEYHDVRAKLDDRRLASMGILVDKDKDENAEWLKQYESGKCGMDYIDLTILLTNNCQFRCKYCFEGLKKQATISESTEHDIISFLEANKQHCGKLRVTWFGGEPLIAYTQLRRLSLLLISFCKTNNIEYIADITTNGYALDEKRINEMVGTLFVRRYIITIDGTEEMHNRRRPLVGGKGTFGRIWNNIAMLVDSGAGVTLRMTIDKENADDIYRLLDMVADSNMKGRIGLAFSRTIVIDFTPKETASSALSEEEYAEVEWQLMVYAHRLGLMSYSFPHAAPLGGCLRRGDIVIGTQGETYKCLDTVGDKKWISGHITRPFDVTIGEWQQVWNAWNPSKSDRCRRCQLQPLCNGGCPHNSLFMDKRHGTESACPDWKPNYKRQIKAIAQQYAESL